MYTLNKQLLHKVSVRYVFTRRYLVTISKNVFCLRRCRFSTITQLVLKYRLWTTCQSQIRSYVNTDGLGVKPHLEPKIRFLLLSDSCGFVDVGRPFWREDGSVVYNCCWSSPAQSFSGPSPAGLLTVFYCLRFETPPPSRRTRSLYLC
jgi:hypothetical protein